MFKLVFLRTAAAAPLLALLAAVAAPLAAQAQPTPLIVDQNRPDRAAPPSTLQPAAPSAARGRVEAPAALAQAFVIHQIQLQGSSLSPAAITAAVKPFVGKPADIETLRAVAAAVAKAYAGSNIALYSLAVPQQQPRPGVLRLVAVEGWVQSVEVKGGGHPLTRAYADHLVGEKPLSKRRLERYAALMRDIPGETQDIQLLQGDTAGAVRLSTTPKLNRYQASITINNSGSSELGRVQVQADLGLYSLFREGEQTHLIVAVPTDVQRFQYYAASHTEPLGSDGVNLTASIGRLLTRPKIAGFEIRGAATTAGVQLSYPLIRGARQNLYLTGGLDGVNSDNAFFGQLISSERTRALRGAMAYGWQTPKQGFSANVSVSHGLDALGARIGVGSIADKEFWKASAQANYANEFHPGYVLRLAAVTQQANDPLPATELLALGGAQFGRAFPASIVTGRSGAAGSAELAWRAPKLFPAALTGSELYGFADTGRVKVDGLATRDHYSLSSAGGGVRIAFQRKYVVDVGAAKALHDPYTGNARGWQLLVGLRTLL